ncbi:MAG TPA: hypothetical protein VLV54_21530 [Thermoanaerobaculia bacterium]|nr:hypothetical protein [Thermoanaerobaculia bacterium]
MKKRHPLGRILFDLNTVDSRKDWWDGSTGRKDLWASVIYLVLSLGPLLWFAYFDICRDWFSKPGLPRLLILAYGTFLSLAPHIWLWLEASAFLDWSTMKYTDELERNEERERFKINADSARAVWAGVVALYAGVLLKFGS